MKVRVYSEFYKEYEIERGNLTIEEVVKKAEDIFLSEKRGDTEGLKYGNKGVTNVVIGLKMGMEDNV